jgi:hypothetical protein
MHDQITIYRLIINNLESRTVQIFGKIIRKLKFHPGGD